MKTKSITEIIQGFIDESVSNEENIPFALFHKGGTENDVEHETIIDWNGRHITIKGDEISNIIYLIDNMEVIAFGNVYNSHYIQQTEPRIILDSLFPKIG